MRTLLSTNGKAGDRKLGFNFDKYSPQNVKRKMPNKKEGLGHFAKSKFE